MFSRQLKNHLDKIKVGEPINIKAFNNLLTELSGFGGFDDDSLHTFKKGKLHLVTYIDADKLAYLESYSHQSSNDRVSAAMQNRSHSFKVNGSLLLIAKRYQHPSVVVFKDGSYVPAWEPTKQAVIIENKELFIHIEQTCKFLIKHCGISEVELNTMDIILGAGNEITNSLHTPFLNKYQKIHLCLDFDLGGITIAKTLIDSLSKAIDVSFLVPDDIEGRLKNVIKECNSDYMERVFNTTSMPLVLLPYMGLIIKHRKVLEQEAYLNV